MTPLGRCLVFGAAFAAAPCTLAAGDRAEIIRREVPRPEVAPDSCAGLRTLALPDGMTTVAEAVPAGAFRPASGEAALPDLPAFCRVALTLTPSSDSDIRIEVWLPASAWSGRFQAVGNGGWSGSISYAAMAAALRRGDATSSTDTGHEGASARFAFGHPEKLVDFGYRSEHEMTQVAKALIHAFYAREARWAYWNGCSGGGRQGLMEAERFPDDFDGILAGAPASNFTGRAVQSMWIAQAVHRDAASAIPPAKFPLIHRAALAACDAMDGVTDGVIDDPARCHFDPRSILCPSGVDDASCLTAGEVDTAERIYGGVSNSRTGVLVFPGHEPGSELGWSTMAGADPFAIGLDYFRYVVFGEPAWNFRSLNFDGDITRAYDMDAGTINALNPDLGTFFGRGGKLIQYHGWSDPQISPGSSVLYYQAVLGRLGAPAVDRAYRLFMVPGMAHCGGGDGPNSFDMLTPLEAWVEGGPPPDRIEAAHATAGRIDRTRPLCPYPAVARYRGTGSTDDASSFACAIVGGPERSNPLGH